MLDPRNIVSTGLKLAERLGDEAYFAALCLRSGMVGIPSFPTSRHRSLRAFERYGLLGGAVTAGAIRFGDRTAIVDEVGELTYKQLDERSNAIANCWREDGLEPGEGVAILVRNHRGFFDAVFAAAKCGARIDPAQHLVRRPPDPRGRRTRGHRPARLRRRVRRSARGNR